MTTSPPAKRRRTLPPSALHKPFRSPLRRPPPQAASGRSSAETPQTGESPPRRTPDGSHSYSQTAHSSVSSSTALSSIQPTQSTAPTLSPSPPRTETSGAETSHENRDPSKSPPLTADHGKAPYEIPDSAPTSVAGASPIRRTPSPPRPHQTLTGSDRAAIHRVEEDIALLRTHPAVRRGATDRLAALIASWTRAARDAAEALLPDFEAGRERRAGGGGGTWADEDWAAGVAEEIAALEAGLEGMGAAERGVVGGEIEGLKGRLGRGRERDGDGERDATEEGEETVGAMGAMLRVMGVEWDLLGWDEQEQGWRP